MNIKELENLLEIPRANIRFYEKEGLISAKRKSNNYRDYTEENVKELKKIILFRKLGFTIEEIRQMQKGELSLNNAAANNLERLEKQIEDLRGALKLTEIIAGDQNEFEKIDGDYYLDILTAEEKKGVKFKDILKDYLSFELDQFNFIWKHRFLFDLKAAKKRYGILRTMGIMLLICLSFGLVHKFIWQDSFWLGFLYPFILPILVSLLAAPLYFLGKKYPKAAGIIATSILILFLLFFAGIFVLILVLILNSFFHFWF